MCGIAVIASKKPMPDMGERLRRMMDAQSHRGPDDEGAYVNEELGVALGHCRLSILDLSAAGRQPMASADGRFILTYNGEIYNFKELRAELEAEGAVFRSGSDTEVLLERSWPPGAPRP